MSVTIALQWSDEADQTLDLPHYATRGAAGADLVANLSPDQREAGITVLPMQRCLVATGLKMAIPEGFEVQIRPRSGLAYKHGVTVANAPGTIDSDYRGEVKVLLINLGVDPFHIEHGMRIAQAVVAPAPQAQWHIGADLSDTSRGSGGFGSTGMA